MVTRFNNLQLNDRFQIIEKGRTQTAVLRKISLNHNFLMLYESSPVGLKGCAFTVKKNYYVKIVK